MNVVPAFRASNPVATARAGTAAVLLAVVLGAAGPALGQSARPDPVLAIVNGTQVHQSDLQLVDEIIGRNLLTHDPVERHETLMRMLIDTILLAQVAKDRKFEDEADIQRRVTFARNQGLMKHLLTTVAEQAVTEEATRKTYEELALRTTTEPELHLRHLFFLIKDPKDEAAVKAAEEKAKAALDRITHGEDFAAVVVDASEDLATKGRRGDYGWRARGEMGKEYADAAFKLKNGEVSPLIKTAVGWHIIKLEDQRMRKMEAYEKIKDRVATMVANRAQSELVDKVRAEAKIERLDQPKEANKAAPNVR